MWFYLIKEDIIPVKSINLTKIYKLNILIGPIISSCYGTAEKSAFLRGFRGILKEEIVQQLRE